MSLEGGKVTQGVHAVSPSSARFIDVVQAQLVQVVVRFRGRIKIGQWAGRHRVRRTLRHLLVGGGAMRARSIAPYYVYMDNH